MDSRRTAGVNVTSKLSRHTIPYMSDTQFRNNPFRRFSRSDSSNHTLDKPFLSSKDSSISKYYTNMTCIGEVKQEPLTEYNSNIKKQKGSKETSEESKECTYNKLQLTKEIEQNFDIMKCLRLSSIEEVKFKELNLPYPKTRRTSDKTLILDLDNTLIYAVNPLLNYSAMDICCNKAESILINNNKNSDKLCVRIMIRPYAKELLKELSKIYEIIVLFFTYK